MGLPLERWVRQALALDRRGLIPEPPKRLLADIGDLARYQTSFWKQRYAALVSSGAPMGAEGMFTQQAGAIPGAQISVTSISGTAALWTSSIFTPYTPPLLAPQGYYFRYQGHITTSTSPANIGFDPRVGTGSTGGSAISGTTLGASTNVALTASITAAFVVVEGLVVCRTIGAPGANSNVYGMFEYHGTQATSSGLAGPAAVGAGHQLLFGGTVAAVDLTVAGGFSLGAVHTVTTITHLVQTVTWLSLN